ncbi:MAG TPA: hypothetical protein VMT68_11000 [Caulobacteraceae bacterium]|nr:hypothetical protein [Caulobacteraceae bacterium]
MAEFSVSDAAFTGFRIVWERPWAVAIWGVLQIVVQLALNVFVAYSAGPAFTKLAQLSFTSGQDPTEVLGLFRQLAPTYAVLLMTVLVLNSVLYAAMNRAVLRPNEARFGYLRLAADELRQLGLFVLYAMLGFAIYLGILVVGTVLVVVAGLATGGAAGATVGLTLAILVPLILCIFVFVGVRFSLASPLTFATQRVDLFGSWGLTKGRFWPLFWTYLIAFCLSIVVSLLVFAIAAIAAMLIGGGGLSAAVSPSDMSSVAAVVAPPRLAYLAITSIGQALIWPVTISPPAAIYRALAQAPGAMSRVFD